VDAGSVPSGSAASVIVVRSALLYPRLGRILVAYTANRIGSWIGLVALSLAVFDHTHSAVAVAGLLLAWQALPAFLVPVVVARVEASHLRRELSGLYLFEALVTGAIALVLVARFQLYAVLLLALLDGTASLTASALLRVEVARTGHDATRRSISGRATEVGEADSSQAELEANSALNVAFSIAFIVGPVLGGIVTAALGAAPALLIDVGSFLVCGAFLLDLHPHVKEAHGESVRSRLRVAWQHIQAVPALRALLVTETLALLFIQTAGPIEVTFAKSTLHAGDRGYGLMVTAWGAGALLGSALFARASRLPLRVTLSVGTLALGAAFVGYAVSPSLPSACLAAAVGGIGNTLEWPALVTLVQRLTPRDLQGQLMGTIESLSAICVAGGLTLGGALVALSDPRTAFFVVGLGTAATAVVFVRVGAKTSEEPPACAAHEGPSSEGVTGTV
jgi:Transmembrane secretion effector